jgi:hypothetical protein
MAVRAAHRIAQSESWVDAHAKTRIRQRFTVRLLDRDHNTKETRFMETTRSLVAALLAATILAACGGGGGSVATTTDTAQTPVWQDEFNGKAVDAGKWSAQIGNGIGSGAGAMSRAGATTNWSTTPTAQKT